MVKVVTVSRGILAAVLLCLAAAVAAEDGPLPVRAVWNRPGDGVGMDLTFSGNPLIVIPAGGALEVGVGPSEPGGSIVLLKDGQPYREDASLHFTAPDKPGAYYMSFLLTTPTRTRPCEICVLVPSRATAARTDRGYDLQVDGREVGHYRHPSRSGNQKVKTNPDSYQPPAWWLRLTEHNAGFEVVPGLTAGELVVPSKDTGRQHTDLVPVVYPMWLTITAVRDALTARGIDGGAMRLISMFRAPAYNRAVGSNAFGRHIYGDAFDFYIDLEGDGKASDLNRDGKLDRRDAYVVVAMLEDLQADGVIPMGGIGVYNTIGGDHVVTMHLDLRGHRATWGYLYNAAGKRSEFSWQSRRFADLDRRDEQAAAARAAREGRKYAPPRREALP